MPVTVSYPGVYVEELPSTSHTITPAPTSIAVFVGYTSPYKTASFDTAVEVFSFQDYQRSFGGFYQNAWLECQVAHAVNQFFINGGSQAYVVGLQAEYHDRTNGTATSMAPATLDINNVTFTAREPTDALHELTVTMGNFSKSSSLAANPDVADITLTYGQVVETYRKVQIGDLQNQIGTPTQPMSSLVTVAVDGGATDYGATPTPLDRVPLEYAAEPQVTWETFDAADFTPVFDQDSSLDHVSVFNLMVLPGVSDRNVLSDALAFCERKRAFLIMDPPVQAAADPGSAPLPLMETLMQSEVPKNQNGAIYFPYLRAADPITSAPIELPPSGFVAGIYASEDTNFGVWKAPAGLETVIPSTAGVVARGRMTDMRQGTLNPLGVNCLRDFPGIGTVVYGARTLVAENPSFEQWKYVPVRRTALFIEQSLYAGLTWVPFQPNDEPLWAAIRTTVNKFMLSLFRQGAFQGTTPSQAFRVTCDSTTTTQTDIDLGIVNILVAFAPLKPAEFVVIQIAQLAGQTQS